MPTTRCRHIVFDKETKRNRLCKKTQYTKNCEFCFVHVMKPFIVQSKWKDFSNTRKKVRVILIQSIWRGFLLRRRLSYLKKFPDEIWNRILFFMKLEYKVKTSYIPSVIGVYNRRIEKYSKLYDFRTEILNKEDLFYVSEITKARNKIIFYKEAMI